MLTQDALRRIDHEIGKYPPDQKQSAVMSALTIAQDQYGWLSAVSYTHLTLPTTPYV